MTNIRTDTSSVKHAEFGWPGGDTGGALEFRCAVDGTIQAAMLEVLSRLLPLSEPIELTLLVASASAAGSYRLRSGNGQWFVRVTSRRGEPDLERELIGHLLAHGVAANEILHAGKELIVSEHRYRLDVRRLLAGRHFHNELHELEALGHTLAACHRAAVTFSRQDDIRRAALARDTGLLETEKRLRGAIEDAKLPVFADREDWARMNLAPLRALAQSTVGRLTEMPGAQPLHGQVHPANVIFEGGRAVLIDFETAVHSFGPREWDLAYLLQRFCLQDDPSPAELRTRLRAFRKGYVEPFDPTILPSMMISAAWLSMVILVRNRIEASVLAPEAEYDKFIRLADNARRHKSLFEEQTREA